MDYQFRLDFEVRDYECDASGIVNNANYQHYLEHTRHQFLRSRGIDFAQWAAAGHHLVVIRIEMDFLAPLHGGERFWVGLNTERISRLRFGFEHTIFRIPDEKPVLRARVIGSMMGDDGRPELPRELARQLDPLF
jgi:acyl-CoA thioester hydrolase